MKIIILGAGRVGATLADNLANDENDITVVDSNPELLLELQEHLDIRTVEGFASHPGTLRDAGADDADLIIAVTRADETNMVACQVAYTLFQVPTKIARIRATQYTSENQLFAQDAIPVDMSISPEELVTNYVRGLIEFPGALEVVDFANGRIRVVGLKAYYGGPLVGRDLRTLGEHLPGIDTRVVAIYRRGKPMVPEGTTVIEADDSIFFVAARQNIKQVMAELQRRDKQTKRVMIAGGGHIGTRLAQELERHCRVKLIEAGNQRATVLSEQISRATVLHGDAADENLLREENIEKADVFCAVTNDEEVNILSAMQARKLGARKSMALISRPSYARLVESTASHIDVAISPQQATVSALLAHVRRGDIVRAHTLRRGAAEAIEVVAHGERDTSRIVGRRIDEIDLPRDKHNKTQDNQPAPTTTIGAILRGDKVIIAHHDTVIESGDHIVLFVTEKRHLSRVERLFQVSPSFL